MQQGDHTPTTPYHRNYPQNPKPNPITTDHHHPPVTYASANTTTYHPPTSEYYPAYPQQNPDPLSPTDPSYDPPPPNPNPQPSIFPKVEASHTPYRSQQPYNPPYDHHQTHSTYPSPPASSIPQNRIPLNHSSSVQYSSSLYNNAPSVPSQVQGPVYESPYETGYDGNYGRSSSDLRVGGGSADYHGKRPDVGMSRFESSGGYGEGVNDIPKADTREGVKGGVKKFRVKLLAESGNQITMDVLCQIGSDDIQILDPSTNRTLRIYSLDTVTRCEVYDSSTFAFWSKSSLDIEPRRIRLQSNSYITNTLLDTLTTTTTRTTQATTQMTNSNVSTHQKTLSLRYKLVYMADQLK
ncbi:unnamed protein product [Lactuca virosa]|uniref:Uncharacterized protein n=1 Tax=Lactuca virosa TaxID=75947 RepID=A0AAU9N9L7_9ASTR|nr:unnamed protein product [Lactuca virosa]